MPNAFRIFIFQWFRIYLGAYGKEFIRKKTVKYFAFEKL